MRRDEELVRRLLKVPGYAEQAGIRLKNTPMPLFELLVLCMLASKPIGARIAVAAARELFGAGIRTPAAVRSATRRDVIAAFGRAHYVRYDESSATRLTGIADRVRREYSSDLRGLAERSNHQVRAATRLLKEFTGIGDTGAAMFLREVQDQWPWLRPYFDDRATAAAERLGLPGDPAELGALAPGANARLAAALVRTSLDAEVCQQVVAP